MPSMVPAYFDDLIAAYRHGRAGRSVHLGYWDTPPPAGGDAGDFSLAQARLDRELLAMSALEDGQSVLDAGCGFGGTLASIDASHSGMRLVGLNVDRRQLAICRELRSTRGNRMEWSQGDACRLPFADRSFDRILCVEAIFHFQSREAFLAEAARVLKPGGMLIGSDILISRSARGLTMPGPSVDEALRDGFGPWPAMWDEPGDIVRFARAAGLDAADPRDVSAQVKPSHRFTAPDVPLTEVTGAARASVMLRWLHDRGLLHYVFFRCTRPAGDMR